jgi:hypothetical protein
MKFLSVYILQLVPICSASSGANALCSWLVLSAHCQELNAHYSGLSIQCSEPSAKSPGTQCPVTSDQFTDSRAQDSVPRMPNAVGSFYVLVNAQTRTLRAQNSMPRIYQFKIMTFFLMRHFFHCDIFRAHLTKNIPVKLSFYANYSRRKGKK